MQIELVKYPGDSEWALCKEITLSTVGKESKVAPSKEWKEKILNARHSPIRTLEFYFKLTDIPYFVSVHLCRHVHALPFVQTQRTDRTGEDRNKKPQDAPVTMWFVVNGEELLTIANKRLCAQASAETQAVVWQMCQQVSIVCPEFKDFLVPMCEYHGGVCHEMNGGCGKCNKD